MLLKKKKTKMSNKKFNCIMIPIMCICAIIAGVGTPIANYFAVSLDNYLGRGELVYEGNSNIKESDLDYYNQTYETSSDGKVDASYAAAELSEKISDEGEVLLKNDGTLPLKKGEKVTPFGYRYVDPIMTGTGSGAATLLQDFVVDAKTAVNEYFTVNKKIEDKLLSADVTYATSDGYKGKADENGTFSGATASVGEITPSIYSKEDIGEYKTAIIVIGRQGGEGNDLQTTSYFDNDGNEIAKHQLQLMPYEKEMIAFAKENCEKVILIINSPNPLELKEVQNDDRINAILWVGTTGCRGFESMAKILVGDVNPSGRLVDTYYADFTADPTYSNVGEFKYSNYDSDQYIEYEEGIYVGYKYYETKYGDNSEEYANQVVYPFGYGLHYDNEAVSQELTSVCVENDNVIVKGKVKNNSSYDVKEVVQIYYEPPYYGEIGESNIEKASKNLIAFDKVEVTGNSEKEFTLTFALEDMASYDYKGFYTEGNGSYCLEAGEYNIYLGKNSHDSWDEEVISLDDTIVYYPQESLDSQIEGCKYVDSRSSDEITATNLYSFMSDYMDGKGDFGSEGALDNLTRANGLENITSTPAEKAANEAILKQIEASNQGDIDYAEYIISRYGNEKPVTNADNDLTLSELRGLDYDDPKWDLLLDQLDFSESGIKEINKLIGNGSFNTSEITSIGKSTTSESDGPQAIGLTGMSDGKGAACAYPAEVLIASTWNVNLAQAMGESIGEEAMAQSSNGWYAPACNIHRSPFQGRIYEYYSEDAVLSGRMAQYTIQGAAEKGYTAYVKHFAVNEQELGRWSMITWVNEQALREQYLRPFEIAVKNAKATEKYIEFTDDGDYSVAEKEVKAAKAIMTSMNRLGGTWTSLDYNLCTTILRSEWGFQGAVITDSANPINNQMNTAISAGNDFFLSFMNTDLQDTTSTAAMWSIRQSIHNICYAVVNSNAMQNVAPGLTYYYKTSPWRYAVIAIDVVAIIVIVGGFIAIRKRKNKKGNIEIGIE